MEKGFVCSTVEVELHYVMTILVVVVLSDEKCWSTGPCFIPQKIADFCDSEELAILVRFSLIFIKGPPPREQSSG